MPLTMLLDDAPAPALLNIKRLASELGCTRQTIHNQLAAGTCPVTPVVGTKPPKFRAVDVEAVTGRPVRAK